MASGAEGEDIAAKRKAIVERLVESGARRAAASQYADAYLQYQEANDNIERNGHLVRDERTMKPQPNPYLPIRDAALKTLRLYKGLKDDWLW